MRTIWHSLLWKEWHEHKWKLVALMCMILMIPLIVYGGDTDRLLVAFSTSAVFYSVFAALLVGMSTGGGENGRGTMQFMQTLPVSMHRPAAIKLLRYSIFSMTLREQAKANSVNS